VVLPASFFVGKNFGLLGVGACWLIVYPSFAALQFKITARLLKIPLLDIVARVTWPMAVTGGMALSTVALRSQLTEFPALLRLVVSVAFAMLAYTGILVAFQREKVKAALELLRTR
jgi:hypothetical protein